MDPLADNFVMPPTEDMDHDNDLFDDCFNDEDFESAGARTPGPMSVAATPGGQSTAEVSDDVVSAHGDSVKDDKENYMLPAQTPGGSRIAWLQKEWRNPCLTKIINDRRKAEAEVQAAKDAAAAAAAPVPERDLNDFERALIRLKGPKRQKERLPDASANKEALKLVQDMKEAQDTDVEALKNGQYACCKITMLKSLVRQVSRANMAEHFVCFGGVDGIADWLSMIDDPRVPKYRRRAPPQVISGLLHLLSKLTISIDVVKSSKIGIVVKQILRDEKNCLEDRRMAETLIFKWLAMITNPKNEDDELGEMEESSRKKVRMTMGETEAAPLLKPRRDQHFWDPSAEQIKTWDTQNREQRHARVPMDKPLFERDALPNVEVKTKLGWNKTDPGTIRGKVDRRVQRMANPNKKAWKSAVSKNVSVEGRGMNLAFQG